MIAEGFTALAQDVPLVDGSRHSPIAPEGLLFAVAMDTFSNK
jgi:hypothetical protein